MDCRGRGDLDPCPFATDTWGTSDTDSNSRLGIWSGNLTPEPMLVLRVGKWLLPLQASHVHSKEEEGKTKGKKDMPAKLHASLRFGCHASS